MDLSRKFFILVSILLLCACSGEGSSVTNDDPDSLFERMISLTLNEQLTLVADYDIEADVIAIEVRNQTPKSIWFEDQSFGVEAFVFNPKSQHWEKHDLGFREAYPRPKEILPSSPRRDASYIIISPSIDVSVGTSLRLLVTGCLDEPCHPDSAIVGAYTDVAIVSATSQVATAFSQADSRIPNSFLHESDFPEGWPRVHSDIREVEGESAYMVTFQSTDYPEFEYAAQLIILYADESQAKQALSNKPDQSKLDLLLDKNAPELDFQSRADWFELRCLDSTSEEQPGRWCAATARYDRLYSSLTVMVYDEAPLFSWADLEKILEAMDRRALEAAGD